MKIIFLTIAFFIIQSTSLNLETVRDTYLDAVSNTNTVDHFNTLFDGITEKDKAVFIAYKGAGLTLKAKKAKKIKDKKNYFIEGVSFINVALSKSPKNIEIRCIRLGIQENSPKILKYKKNIEEDKAFLLDHYPNITSSSLKKYIHNFILQSKIFTEEEKMLLNNN